MNRHINQNQRNSKLGDALSWGGQFKVVERDTMPKEVAVEMLCAPKARTTNRERKTWNDARQTVFESQNRPVNANAKMSVWLQGRNWMQIHQALGRVELAKEKALRHLAFLQKQALKLDSRVKEQSMILALLERQMAALDVHIGGLDSTRELLQNELERRADFCAQLHQLTPSVAKKLRRQLCGYAPK